MADVLQLPVMRGTNSYKKNFLLHFFLYFLPVYNFYEISLHRRFDRTWLHFKRLCKYRIIQNIVKKQKKNCRKSAKIKTTLEPNYSETSFISTFFEHTPTPIRLHENDTLYSLKVISYRWTDRIFHKEFLVTSLFYHFQVQVFANSRPNDLKGPRLVK